MRPESTEIRRNETGFRRNPVIPAGIESKEELMFYLLFLLFIYYYLIL
jgi:hypothetical protein